MILEAQNRDDWTNEYLDIVFQHGDEIKILHLSEIMVDNSLINSWIFHSLKITELVMYAWRKIDNPNIFSVGLLSL